MKGRDAIALLAWGGVAAVVVIALTSQAEAEEDVLESLVRTCKQDVAQRLSLNQIEDVKFVSAEETTFQNSLLGYRIVLQAYEIWSQTVYEYEYIARLDGTMVTIQLVRYHKVEPVLSPPWPLMLGR